MRAFADPKVAARFDAYPEDTRAGLLKVRDLVFQVADAHPRIGALSESLKWGQPDYRPTRNRVGTTVRLDAVKTPLSGYAVYFHCQTGLVERFRTLHVDALAFQGNRAILFDTHRPPANAPLAQCLEMALTHHLR
ncbi:MAG: DUF1801 domain-containing protein [Chloroflexota bacterium]